jgi:hypothetical protein
VRHNVARVGNFAIVINRAFKTSRYPFHFNYAIFADVGPAGRLGEVQLPLRIRLRFRLIREPVAFLRSDLPCIS